MEVTEKSLLYRNAREIVFNDGTSVIIRDRIDYEPDDTDEYYTIQEEETLDEIAHRYYGGLVEDGYRYWWVIADANDIHNPLDMASLVGTDIVVPNIFSFKLKYQQ